MPCDNGFFNAVLWKAIELFFVLVGLGKIGMLVAAPLVLVFNSVPLFLAGFFGTLFGMRLLDDLNGSDNLYNYKIELLKWFGFSVAAALLVGFFNPQIAGANNAVVSMIAGMFK